MSHDDPETDTAATDDQFPTDASTAHISVMGQVGSGKTTITATELALRVEEDAESVETIETIDPKGEDDVECPLGDQPAASETPQNSSEDSTNREEERGESQ